MIDPPQDFSRYSSLNASDDAENLLDPPVVSSKMRKADARDKYSVEPSTHSPNTFSCISTPKSTAVPNPTLGDNMQYKTTVQNNTIAMKKSQQTKSNDGSSSVAANSFRSNNTPFVQTRHWMTTGTPSPRTPKSVHFTENSVPFKPVAISSENSPRVFQTHDWIAKHDDMSAVTETPQSYPGGLAKPNHAIQHPTKGLLPNSTTVLRSPTSNVSRDDIKSPEIKRPQADTDAPSKPSPFSMFSCSTGTEVVHDPPPSTPVGFACGLIQEEVSLLNKSQKNKNELLSKSPRSPTQAVLYEPVHAKWLQQDRKPNIRPTSQTTQPSLGASVSSSPTPPTSQQPVINLTDTPGPPSVSDSSQDYGKIFEYNPLRPSKHEVLEMLNEVKRQRQIQKNQKAASRTSSVSESPVFVPTSDISNPVRTKPKLEPEEVFPITDSPKTHPPTKYKKMEPKAASQANGGRPTAESAANSTFPQVESDPNQSKSTMVLTRKSNIDTSFLDHILPRPKSTTAAWMNSKEKEESRNSQASELWNDARRQRYENLKGRVQPSLPPPMKISSSMQVESSSTDGSFFSFSGVDDQAKKTNNELEMRQPNRSSPRLPPRHDVTPRPDFWGLGTNRVERESPGSQSRRDRIEESRDGRDDEDTEGRRTFMDIRDRPQSITIDTNQSDLDRIESMRGSPTDHVISQFHRILGIPSLNSKPSSESQLNIHPRTMKTDFATDFAHQRQIHLEIPARSASAPRPRLSPMVVPSGLKQAISTPDNKIRATPRKKSSPISGSPGTPKLDQKTVRLLYASEFSDMVRKHSKHHVVKILSENIVEKIPNPGVQTGLSFVIRKRPLLQDEFENGDFDVVEAPPIYPDALVLYEASILADRRTRDLKAHLFRFDAVFPDDVSEDDFYLRLGQPYVLNAMGGGNGTFILVGGPRSGKSHMISELEERAIVDIFVESSYGVPNVTVRCLDLYGEQCIDLLGPLGTFVRVVESNGTYGIKGAVTSSVSSPHDMLSLLENAKRRFTTQSIVRRRNDGHSYFICEIMIGSDDLTPGCLTFVECPYGDLPEHSTRRTSESIPLTDLMENIRAKVSGKEMSPNCNLTKLLCPKMQSQHSETCVIGAISPGSLDTETTLSALLWIKKLMKVGTSNGDGSLRMNIATTDSQQSIQSPTEKTVAMPRAWSKDAMLSWMEKKKLITPESKQDLTNASEEELSGRAVMRMTKMQLKRSFYDELEDGEKRAEKLFIALRAENDRVGRQRIKQRRAREKMGMGSSYTP
ncbi:kinesin motor domain containing protein [Nitzschia inconspicua]|uniref:Kinesin motor domain containing protein n=1 Tax=Nitzschia inconspicua TaxID=303405 RepID=A0A9K3PX11_9STRA|nr:kinesin motor domain containing protein [Nitzschia inconspicua]